ncbi:MAG: MBOAT family protein [Butyrivibrio sp.]|nr:MBOAT family protein [Butyrivibrio sp.]
MDFLSLGYIAFTAAALVLYYRLPRAHQWKVLLAANLLFYLLVGRWNIAFILVTAFSVWYAAILLDRLSEQFKAAKKTAESREEKKVLKSRFQNKKRFVLFLALVLNFGILAFMKYFRVMGSWGQGLLVPLGISFYTFQAVGYLVDVHGEKYEAEKRFPRFLLFVSFFPQLVQGPINRYGKMGPQFEKEHSWSAERAKRAVILILFGLMKKYAVANMLTDSIARIFDSPADTIPGSLVVCGILLYSVQQYADFSGGIDIVLGVAQLFDLEMMPNFRQPYFAVSLGDFWRRWHISLGAWMRDYVFYPFALLKPMQNFGKWCSKHLGKHFGRVLPAGIANILVFFLVGVWHGAYMHYVWWGLYNGIVIALSDILEPTFGKVSELLHLPLKSRGMHIFRVIRTFVIVNIGWYFDRIEDMGQCLACFGRTVSAFKPGEFLYSFSNVCLNPELVKPMYVLGGMVIALVGTVVIFAVSLWKELHPEEDIHERYGNKALTGLSWVFLSMMVLVSFVFTTTTGGFLYANF